eukprot:4268736-Alexandrium_andersonii.AAC.1
MGWQASLNLHCYKCWYEKHKDKAAPDDFDAKKDVMIKRKAAWDLRLQNSVDHVNKRVREMRWQKAKTDVGDRHLGESQREYRNWLIEATCAIANAISRDALAASPKQRAEFEEAFDYWDAEWQKKATGPTYVPKLGGKLLSDYEAQFLNYITKNVSD